jgi:hypothetical protein
MTEAKNRCFKPGELIADFEKQGLKITPAIRSMDNLIPQLTCAEVQEYKRELAIYILIHDDPDPEFRRELLSSFETCPCCQQWLGHNRPPRQGSFEFDP